MKFSHEHKRLTELLGLVHEVGLEDSQAAELEEILTNDPESLAYYIEAIDLISMLHRKQGIVVDKPFSIPSTPQPTAIPKHYSWWAAAISASLVIGALIGPTWHAAKGSSKKEGAIAIPTNRVYREIATLSFATGCRWATDEESRYEGQRLNSETLRLESGVVVIHFDCDVQLVLEGPAQLQLVSVDRAVLGYGNVVFSSDSDIDSFTLETPFSKILDKGTEYGLSVDRSGKVSEVHVFDGQVIWKPSEQKSIDSNRQLIQIDAGNARRFTDPISIETIELASNRFVREPVVQFELADSAVTVESFAYDTEPLAGKNGGLGWLQAWRQYNRLEAEFGATLRKDSLVWRNKKETSTDGSLMIGGNSYFGRMLQDPIRMDHDATYYLSFLVRRDTESKGMESEGWAYIILRNSHHKVGNVAIAPVTIPGAPRVYHDGRVTDAASPLREGLVYLFVCKISARKEQDDQIQVRIYADHESVDFVEPSTWNITTRPIRNDGILDELKVTSEKSPLVQFDELRIGRTWSSVASAYFQ